MSESNDSTETPNAAPGRKPALRVKRKRITDIRTLFRDLIVRPEAAAKMCEAEMLIPGLIPRGHIVSIPAPSGGGKTAIFHHFAGILAAQGEDVIYIDVDSPPDALKTRIEVAEEEDFSIISPDAIPGKSLQDVKALLIKVAESNFDVSRVVIIIDTLKKFVEMLNKEDSKKFYKLMRRITAKGATIILLSHTNKYPGEDGLQVYEGTGDARADVDDMVYLDSEDYPEERWMWVTTRIAKQRAILYPRSFHVNYKVFPAIVTEHKDVYKLLEPADRVVFAAMKDALADGAMNQGELVAYLSNNTPYGRDKLKTMLWRVVEQRSEIFDAKSGDRNTRKYSLKVGAVKPA